MAGGSRFRAAALALAAMGVLATHDAMLKILGARYAPWQTLFFVALFSFPLVTLALVQDRRPVNLRPSRPGWVAVRSLALVASFVTAMYALSVLSLPESYALFFTMPLWVTILAVPLLGERVRPGRALATLLGLAGVLIVLRPGTGAGLGPGHLAALGSALCSALAGVIARRLGGGERSVVLLFWPVVGNLLLGAAMLPAVYRPMPLGDLGLLAGIALLSLAGNALMVAAYRVGEAALVAPMQYSQIIWAVVYGYLLFDAGLQPLTLVGIVVIIAAGLLSMRQTPDPTEAAPATGTRFLGFPRLTRRR